MEKSEQARLAARNSSQTAAAARAAARWETIVGASAPNIRCSIGIFWIRPRPIFQNPFESINKSNSKFDRVCSIQIQATAASAGVKILFLRQHNDETRVEDEEMKRSDTSKMENSKKQLSLLLALHRYKLLKQRSSSWILETQDCITFCVSLDFSNVIFSWLKSLFTDSLKCMTIENNSCHDILIIFPISDRHEPTHTIPYDVTFFIEKKTDDIGFWSTDFTDLSHRGPISDYYVVLLGI